MFCKTSAPAATMALANLTTVEQGGTHAYQGMVVDGAGMHGDVMSDGHIVTDMRGTCLMGHMDTGAVLHIGAVADGDRCHVATYHRVEPH